ncbi:MAG: hypothetical protein L6408_03065 [Nanoarchaeota archaeon]|nr:hypothetical protein [Nanoarchaeota archaeon]
MFYWSHYWQGAAKAVPRTKHSMYYISTEHKEELYNSQGKTMDSMDKEYFLEQTEEKRNSREIVVSPENNMSREELHTYTQNYMETIRNEKNGITKTNGQSMDYCYSIHEDTDHTHVHIIENGRWPDLEQKDMPHCKELAAEQFHEQGQSLMQDQQLGKGFEEKIHEEIREMEREEKTLGMGLGL